MTRAIAVGAGFERHPVFQRSGAVSTQISMNDTEYTFRCDHCQAHIVDGSTFCIACGTFFIYGNEDEEDEDDAIVPDAPHDATHTAPAT